MLVTMPSSFLSTNSPSVKLISLRIDSSGFDDAGKDRIIDLKSFYICKKIYLLTCLHTIYINFRKLLLIQINLIDLLISKVNSVQDACTKCKPHEKKHQNARSNDEKLKTKHLMFFFLFLFSCDLQDFEF